jgi:hypothetical protein
MRIIAAFAAVGGFIGAAVAGALYWIGASSASRVGSGWWTFASEPRRYVDYLPVGMGLHRHLTTRFLTVAVGGGVVAGLVLGASLAWTGFRLVRVSGSSPTG